MAEKPSDPTNDPEFKRVLKNLLNTPHKPQAELKAGKTRRAVVAAETVNKKKAAKAPSR
jgi:hypothetical protein